MPAVVAKRLTARQEQIVGYVLAYWLTHGYGPSLRDVSTACGGVSTSVVAYNLAVLERAGHLVLGPAGEGRARSIRPRNYSTWWKDGRPVISHHSFEEWLAGPTDKREE